MRTRFLIAATLLGLASLPAQAQEWNSHVRNERFQEYQRLRADCERGSQRACVNLGHMQERFSQRVREDCQRGDRDACQMEGRIQERRREESGRRDEGGRRDERLDRERDRGQEYQR